MSACKSNKDNQSKNKFDLKQNVKNVWRKEAFGSASLTCGGGCGGGSAVHIDSIAIPDVANSCGKWAEQWNLIGAL